MIVDNHFSITEKNYIDTLINGDGYFILPQVFNQEDIATARDLIIAHSNHKAKQVTHFQGANKDKIEQQRRVWNLLNKGTVFIEMAQHPMIMEIVGEFLGDEFCMGSIAANRILPNGPGQEPHIDYPYWDMYKRTSFPYNINHSYPLNCQVTILLDDFTPENGATAVLPHSQTWCRYPTEEDHALFNKNAKRMLGKAGDVAIFYGLVWHCAMPNYSSEDRIAVLIQYLPKFIKPMEDQVSGVKQKVLDEASPMLKQLLGQTYPYPQLLEQAQATNTEGRIK